MSVGTVCAIAGAIVVWALLSSRLERLHITAPMLFVAVGVALGGPGVLDVKVDSSTIEGLARVTLVLLLFSDAARIRPSALRRDAGLPIRLLLIGLPLTLALGTLAAWFILPAASGWMALLVAACLAPTDAGLCAAMVNDPKIPTRIRQSLNVESGLNDGICTPFITLAIAGLASIYGLEQGHAELAALRELGLGLAVGVIVGLFGGWLLATAATHNWMERGADSIAVLAMPILAYGFCILIHGNGFVAAFVAGIAFAPFLPALESSTIGATELSGQILSTVVWFVFGAALRVTIPGLEWQLVVYALLSLTVIRMLPVASALLGAGLDRTSVAFIGWFGPRGLASIVFAIVALEDLGSENTTQLLKVVTLTVLASVVLHGATAAPLAARYHHHVEQLHTEHPVHQPVASRPMRRPLGRPTPAPEGSARITPED
jgi:NhaP-type Na+/H+ or K+/H+ antiporter